MTAASWCIAIAVSFAVGWPTLSMFIAGIIGGTGTPGARSAG